MTSAGSQKFPSVAMTPSGEYVEVWCGNGVGDQSGIFARRYEDPTDTAGPLVTRIAGPDGKSVLNVLLNPDLHPGRHELPIARRSRRREVPDRDLRRSDARRQSHQPFPTA